MSSSGLEGFHLFACSFPDRGAILSWNVRTLTLRIAAPSLAAMLATGLCTLLDALLVSGQAPAVSAAVGVCFPLLSLQQAVGFTLGMGAGSHMSRALGAGDEDSARQVAGAALLLSLLLGAALAACALVLPALLPLLGAQEGSLPAALAYARPLLLASPFSCAGLVLSSLLRAQGKTPPNMLAYVLASAAGAALSFYLISLRGMGAAGAGYSLLTREALACLLLAAFFLRGQGLVRPRLRDMALHVRVFPAILRSGLPTLLRQGAMSAAGLVQSRVSAGFGPAALSGMGIAARAGALVQSASIGFGQGFAPVCGMNHGAGRHDRVREAYRFCMRVMVVSLLLVGAGTFVFAGRLLALFDAEADVAAVAVQVLRAQSVVFFAQGAVILMNMLTQSMGQTVRASLVAVSRHGILLPLLLLLPRWMGFPGLVLCPAVADALALALSFAVTRGCTAVDRNPEAN